MPDLLKVQLHQTFSQDMVGASTPRGGHGTDRLLPDCVCLLCELCSDAGAALR